MQLRTVWPKPLRVLGLRACGAAAQPPAFPKKRLSRLVIRIRFTILSPVFRVTHYI
ncbi:protein of unknown function [Cupriavidus taiwanensis]|uniref:Uncharacterized protein n=1 Tax=Cupriavidus taiwanensis TaxID=164546 RepID=A0A9Q7UW91_9BURK|nr:protein of unknown function [Cupriavidus taiwanensis]